jgi:DNA polymerase III, epsilon subunit, Proteobacterial
MRQVVLDTETTGLEPPHEHRVIEIGCVELINRRMTGNRFHQYLQPDRSIDPGALEVHGLTADFLADKPHFCDIIDDFLKFITGAELIIHNAPFDVGFLNRELALAGADTGTIDNYCTVFDTLLLARQLHPGQKNSLNALCRRYGIDNSHRELHGALLDAKILTDVYLVMTGGQASLTLDNADPVGRTYGRHPHRVRRERPKLKVVRANEEELAAHARRLEAIDRASGGHCVWKKLGEE